MKVLVATEETQGRRGNDFCHVPEGELVMDGGSECSREGIDGRCGCRRSFVGLKSHKATTTARVVNVVLTDRDRPGETDEDVLERMVRESLKDAGWLGIVGEDEDAKLVQGTVGSILRVAAVFEPGTVVEQRGTKIQERPR